MKNSVSFQCFFLSKTTFPTSPNISLFFYLLHFNTMSRQGSIFVLWNVIVAFVMTKSCASTLSSSIKLGWFIRRGIWWSGILCPNLMLFQGVWNSVVVVVTINVVTSYRFIKMVIEVLDHRRIDPHSTDVISRSGRRSGSIMIIKSRQRRLNPTGWWASLLWWGK